MLHDVPPARSRLELDDEARRPKTPSRKFVVLSQNDESGKSAAGMPVT
jgi:hypothetical protein